MNVNITKDLVAHVGKLCMIKINDKDMGEYQNHLSKTLKHIEELDAVNTEGVKAYINPMRERLDLFADHNDRREDIAASSMPVADVLKNAPDQTFNQFKIEAVIREGE